MAVAVKIVLRNNIAEQRIAIKALKYTTQYWIARRGRAMFFCFLFYYNQIASTRHYMSISLVYN